MLSEINNGLKMNDMPNENENSKVQAANEEIIRARLS